MTEHTYKAWGVYCSAHPATYLLACTITHSCSAGQMFCSVFCCDSAAGPVWGDQRLQITSYPQRSGVLKEWRRRGWERGVHLETDRITDWHTAPWVNFSLLLTLSFGGKKKNSTRQVIYEHIFIFSSTFALILPCCQHILQVSAGWKYWSESVQRDRTNSNFHPLSTKAFTQTKSNVVFYGKSFPCERLSF